jgi:diguanylate cyclase (GGDEF)-like protein
MIESPHAPASTQVAAETEATPDVADGRPTVTESDWATAQRRSERVATLTGLAGLVTIPLICLAAMGIGDLTTDGSARYAVALVSLLVLLSPMVALMVRYNLREKAKGDGLVGTLTRQLAQTADVANQQAVQRLNQARRQEFESRLANALDMAEGEPEVVDVIERSFKLTMPHAPVELLLADNSHAHLLRMANASPTEIELGCSVDSPDHCPAARRAQVQRFDDSDDLDACPKLRGRPGGALSALCVPVSIMGRTVGVIHATGEPSATVSDDTVGSMETLAKLAGARLGLLRVMAETQLQAATDNLTGLLNRRSFEQRVTAIRSDNPVLALAMADLDHFKVLNDTYGHETGDRALRLFAQVLSGSVRTQDLVCRHGGEEFVVALVGCTAASSREILDSLRSRLDAAITVAGLPEFTVSIGVVEAGENEKFPSLIARADAALFQAKRDGRNRVVITDAAGAVLLDDTSLDGLDTDGLDRLDPSDPRYDPRAERLVID